uniref:Micro-fibrillar-associated protein 1 C-terminal domain-containing protein n=1 Tax=Coccolithus braarudii TaxID=221442 RepID=A0A6T7D7H0_9EUKA|mmetsp:Transcript_14010/g.30389  ORF Transcript_14010/g.30389 Transcript_14010/m.30389 type:complete len:478 (+) Transcript_14010:60-1493(+)|eukprot:CAMPEP_0183382444 /NCGR_PEP_ID=MMETSP0164_2-20130417/126940_1 /TAXON_ID=221442 /ORGANISM="Coccolithus pelagicus ssp braarudi, Strain PLY182g" /LENGTH=477 /DNA_ID=CAMNT_0025560065 /DNA_START=54 /DNA_END=1487 /DNA_ORIENTATION=-
MHRAAQGEQKVRAKGLTGSGRHGGTENKVEMVKVARYWPGKAPDASGTPVVEDDLQLLQTSGAAVIEDAGGGRGVDRRLARLMESKGVGGTRRRSEGEVLEEGRHAEVLEENTDGDAGGLRDRRTRGAVTEEEEDQSSDADGEDEEEKDDEEEDDDAIEARRQRLLEIRRKSREAEQRQEELARDDDNDDDKDDSEAEGEESSEYETDSEEEEAGRGPRVMLKPVFIADSERETIKERELQEQEQESMKAKRAERLQERQIESRQMLVEIVQSEELGEKVEKAIEFADMPDDDDELDELDQFDAWKLREMRRLKREGEERRQAEREAAEIERRRKLTDEQRRREDEEFNKQRVGYGQEKAKWKFLQKYYHKGAYFQDEDETGNNKIGPVMAQDFGVPTGKDAIGDKAAMPKPMQVKNFGMRSQVKWTHLTAEDTSTKDDLWLADNGLRGKYQARMAGVKASNDFARPTTKRQRAGGL